MKHILVLFISLICVLPISAGTQTDSDSIVAVDTALLNIYKQLMVFPQEKIYIQTDKPYYVAGETVFYRLFLLDACFHIPFPISRYVYVELIDQNNTVEIRRKIRPENEGLYYNSIKLSENLAQGYYKIRAYTRYMENTGIENFYSKPLFVIAENKEHLKMEMNVATADKKHTSVELRFVNAGTGTVETPENLFLQLNGKKQKISYKKNDDDVFEFKLPLTDDVRERSLYVEVLDKEGAVVFKQFDVVPYTGDSIELTFYPEGGYLVEGQSNVIAFKALCKDGAPAEITGIVMDSDGTEISQLSTKHDGMGMFFLIPEKGKHYVVEYQSAGKLHKIPLPDFKTSLFSLHGTWRNDKLWISINKEQNTVLPPMYLLVHCRGDMLYFSPWNGDKDVMTLEKDFLRSGVNHLILLSEDYHPLSERLVFCNRNDHIKPQIKTERQTYKSREHVTMDISVDGIKNFSLYDSLSTSLAVSVTSDNEVEIDTTTNILTEILLESELKGAIVNPAYYFSDTASADADLLMMTHGWTRYDLPKAMRGEWTVPSITPETMQILTGKVVGGLLARDAANIEVSAMSYRGKEKFFNVTITDENGLYRFENFELPDSSDIVLQALKGKKRRKGLLEVLTDTTEYPLAGDFNVPLYRMKTTGSFIEEVIAETDWRYVYINGVRMIEIPEIIIKKRVNKKPKQDGSFHVKPDFLMTIDDIEESGIDDVLALVGQLPYVTVQFRQGMRSTVEVETLGITGKKETPAIYINGIQFGESPMDALALVHVNEIAEIHLINSTNKIASITTLEGENKCIIEIITKTGLFYDRRQRFHFKSLIPLGYATPTEFYSPKYDTKTPDDEIENPDLRTTVYWKPDVVLDKDGKSSVDFYSADRHTTYSVVTEGISPNGTLIYKYEKAILKVDK